jgi:mannose/fructose-specific phosphotransferase system component IIA
MVKGLIVGHRDFGAAVLRVMETVCGDVSEITFLSNDGFSADEMMEEIRGICSFGADDGVVVFVDMYGGSCWRAAKRAQESGCRIVTGFNLPMLLSFIHKRQTMSFDDLVDAIAKDGKRAITVD